MKDCIKLQLINSQAVIAGIMSDNDLCSRVEEAANACINSLNIGGKLMFAGNGGSAADAQHMAGEFVSRFAFDRPGLAAIALTTDSSILTAIGNDYGFDNLFTRQIQAIGIEGDVFVAYSTSGNSQNIINALIEAKKKGLFTIGFTGRKFGAMNQHCDCLLDIPSTDTARIQECHILVGHIICGLTEEIIFSPLKI